MPNNSTTENNMIFFENIKKLCIVNGISVTTLAIDLGLSRSTSSGWRKGSQPRGKTLKMIAEYFNVTVDQLIERPNADMANSCGNKSSLSALAVINDFKCKLSEQEEVLLNIFEQLSIVDQAKLIVYAEELKNKSEK